MLRGLNITLLLISLLVFAFALVSGAEGKAWYAILSNSPNAWPWLLLLLLNYFAWKKPKVAGVLVTLFGLAATYFFNFGGGKFYPLVFGVTMLITLIETLQVYLAFKAPSEQ